MKEKAIVSFFTRMLQHRMIEALAFNSVLVMVGAITLILMTLQSHISWEPLGWPFDSARGDCDTTNRWGMNCALDTSRSRLMIEQELCVAVASIAYINIMSTPTKVS